MLVKHLVKIVVDILLCEVVMIITTSRYGGMLNTISCVVKLKAFSLATVSMHFIYHFLHIWTRWLRTFVHILLKYKYKYF